MSSFVRKNIFCWYEVPYETVSDNGMEFKGEFQDLVNEYHIQHHKSSPYRPQTNGVV